MKIRCDKNITGRKNLIGLYAVTVTVILVVLVIVCCVHIYLSSQKAVPETGYTYQDIIDAQDIVISSWNNCVEKMDYKSDVVFFGDSITRWSDFRLYFDKSIVNLGLSGDTITGIKKRVSMVSAFSPKTVFLLVGINEIKDTNVDECIKKYNELIEKMCTELQDSKIIVQSVLPISYEKESLYCKNKTIIEFNKNIKKLSEKYNLTYVDLFDLYCDNGYMNSGLTKDGVHLNQKGYDIWAEAIQKYFESD